MSHFVKFLNISPEGSDFNHKDSPVFSENFVIALYTGDSSDFYINMRKYKAMAGDVLVLPPGALFQAEDSLFPKTLAVPVEIVMELPSPFDTGIIASSRIAPVIHPNEEDQAAIAEYFLMVEKAYNIEKGIYKEEIVKSFLFALIYKIGEVYAEKVEEKGSPVKLNDERLSDDFFFLLARHYKNERTVKFYARQMGLTPKYLSKAIKGATGKSVHEWIDDTIILEIKNLLKTTDYSVLQISEFLNFCSPSAFVQFFKLHVGITPFKYRNSDGW